MGSAVEFDDAVAEMKEILEWNPDATNEELIKAVDLDSHTAAKAVRFARPEGSDPVGCSLYAAFKREDPRPAVAALVELARGCAREGHLVEAALTPRDREADDHVGCRCAACYSASNVMPQRIGKRERMICVLLCEGCQRRLGTVQYRGEVHKRVKNTMEPAPTVLLFKEGQRLRMVGGEELRTEVLV